MKRFVFYTLYKSLTRCWLLLERRASWKSMRKWTTVPDGVLRGVSFDGYTQWVMQQGYMQGLLSNLLGSGTDIAFLDIGCGMGKFAPVCVPWLGTYTGIDSHASSIAEARRSYGHISGVQFQLINTYNAFYNPCTGGPEAIRAQLPQSDIVIAHSLFTHLRRRAAQQWMDKIEKALRLSGTAIVTFHVIGSNNELSFPIMLDDEGYFTLNADCPEHGIALTYKAAKKLITDSGLKIVQHTSAGPHFQDVFVLKRR